MGVHAVIGEAVRTVRPPKALCGRCFCSVREDYFWPLKRPRNTANAPIPMHTEMIAISTMKKASRAIRLLSMS